jgi:hypothetical protein
MFGTGKPDIIRRFSDQVYSTDATSWNIGSKYGHLLSLSGYTTLQYAGKMHRGKRVRDICDFYNLYRTAASAYGYPSNEQVEVSPIA